MKEENVKSEYQRKVDKSLIPTCNIMGVNIAAINMNWLLKYIDENLSDIKGDYICVSNVHTTVTSYEDFLEQNQIWLVPIITILLTVIIKMSARNQSVDFRGILKAEYLLPIYIDELLQAGRVSVKVLDTNDKWFGVTYKEDKDYVVKSFARLIEAGVYQKNLFEDTYTPSLFVKNFILPKEREEGIAVEN